MNYALVMDAIKLVEAFEAENSEANRYPADIAGFKTWIKHQVNDELLEEPHWEGKEHGRSPESVISTFLVHMNRYAKTYSKSAIHDSGFSTQEDFIYLITLKTFGAMSKMELIKRNIHEKPAGIQIINRLIEHGWVEQTNSETDKRSKMINITPEGRQALEQQMGKIRQATELVTGDLTHPEKMQLITLLSKLNNFHHTIYRKNLPASDLLNSALNHRKTKKY